MKQLEDLEGGKSCEKLLIEENQGGKIEPGTSKKKQGDIRSFIQGVKAEKTTIRSPNYELEGPVTSPAVEEKEETICKIKKGQCLEHKMEAIKKTITSKKWGMKKDGLSGWIVSKRVRWFCPAKKMTPEAPNFDSKSCPSSRAAPVISNMGIRESFLGIMDNYNHGEEGER